MELSAIIAEYNPLHNGHIYHIKEVRKLGAPVLVLLSGAFVQRGEAAIADKYQRAANAVQEGADIVLELPPPFSISPAEQYALGAVRLLSSINCNTTLCFGSECGSLEPIINSAKILLDKTCLSEAVKIGLQKGQSYPLSLSNAFFEYAQKSGIHVCDITKPNNILAVEYAKANILCNNPLSLFTTLRESAYHNPSFVGFSSASQIREYSYDGKLDLLSDKLPQCSYQTIKEALSKRQDNSVLYLSALCALKTEGISKLYDVTEGLENRIYNSAKNACTYAEYQKTVATSRYTKSRIQRISAYALLGITKSVFEQCTKEQPVYNLLACKKSQKDKLLPLLGSKLHIDNHSLEQSFNTQAALMASSQNQYRLLNGYANNRAVFID